MALPSSGPISMTDIYNEFRLNSDNKSSVAISSHLRGGSRVSSHSKNSRIKAIQSDVAFSDYYGASNTPEQITLNLVISTNTFGYNLYNAVVAAGWDPTSGTIPIVTVTVNAGVVVGGGSSASGYAFKHDGSYPAGSSFTLYNRGSIVGAGGRGGDGMNGTWPGAPGFSSLRGGDGSNGGDAMYVSLPLTVYNYGTIAGGGGGGAGGGMGALSYNSYDLLPGSRYWGGAGGGGGAGSPGGGTGTAGTDSNGGGYYINPQPGSVYAGGAGGRTGGVEGGGGGGLGGSGGGTRSITLGPGGSGGAAGRYIVGSSNVSWAVAGTRLGSVL